MAELTSGVVKELAKDWGADIVGIASVDRFEGAPPGHGPLDLMPESKSVIVAGIRIPDPVVDYERYHLKMEEMAPGFAIEAVAENFYIRVLKSRENMSAAFFGEGNKQVIGRKFFFFNING